MIIAALFTLAGFALTWIVFSLVAYTFIYGSLIFAYIFVWDGPTRKEICPNGLISAILHDQ